MKIPFSDKGKNVIPVIIRRATKPNPVYIHMERSGVYKWYAVFGIVRRACRPSAGRAFMPDILLRLAMNGRPAFVIVE